MTFLLLIGAALVPALGIERVSVRSLTRVARAWQWGLFALGIVWVGLREPWLGVIGAYLLWWWPQPAARDALARDRVAKAGTVWTWAAIAGTWFLALELPAWAWAWLPAIWGGWAWLCSGVMVWQAWKGDAARVRGWWGLRSIGGAFLALVLPILPLWAWPGPLVGVWLSGPSWLAVVALAAASAWRWPEIGLWGGGAVVATGATLVILTACRPRVGAITPTRLPGITSPGENGAPSAVKNGDRDDDPVGSGGAGGPHLVQRAENAEEVGQAGLREHAPGLLQRALGAVSLGAQAARGPVPEWWATLWTRPLELTPRGDSLDSVYQRLALLRLAWQQARSERTWLMGTGPGTTKSRHFQAHIRGELDEATGTLHNEPAQMASEYGLLGLASCLLFMWRVGSGLTWGDPWSAAAVAGLVLACGTMALRIAPLGLLWLLVCAKVVQ